jgi:hypothetical protein
VLFKELHRVVGKPLVERGQAARMRGVSAKLIDAGAHRFILCSNAAGDQDRQTGQDARKKNSCRKFQVHGCLTLLAGSKSDNDAGQIS